MYSLNCFCKVDEICLSTRRIFWRMRQTCILLKSVSTGDLIRVLPTHIMPRGGGGLGLWPWLPSVEGLVLLAPEQPRAWTIKTEDLVSTVVFGFVGEKASPNMRG